LWGYRSSSKLTLVQEYDIVLLGGLAGRLDQTIHTLSYLYKLRKTRKRVFAVTDDNAGWVLDAVRVVVGPS
jgi:thiamine pyrophosphokinase